MSMRDTGEFTLGLKSLELQIQTLLENAGGGKATKLLDIMCKISKEEQELVLAVFSKVINKIVEGDTRLQNMSYGELKEFEDKLYEDIVAEIESEEAKGDKVFRKVTRFKVLNGGSKTSRKPKNHLKPVVSIDALKRDREDSDLLH